MKVLAIESSCDDTSVALLNVTDKIIEILAEKTASQIDVHKKYGGIVPEIAGRKHAEQILPVVEEIIKGYKKPDVIAVTSGPGLITGLIVGVEAAKTLSYLWNVPLIGVNHIEGHIFSAKLNLQDTSLRHELMPSGNKQIPNTNFQFPVLCLVASGGHTELILMEDYGIYKKIGGTRDDAAGEAFDKVAKLLGLEYPGGPKISKLALEGNPHAIAFPRPMLDSDNYDMSFAGLKTAALYWLQDNAYSNDSNSYNLKPKTLQDFCASYEQAIVDVLVAKTAKAIKEFKPKLVILGGGVSANKKLRETLEQTTKSLNLEFKTPNLPYAMDNATMIGLAAYEKAKRNEFITWDKIQANPNWKIYNNISTEQHFNT